MKPSVEIIMSSYHGEAWLDVQLATIFSQDYEDWRLLIRDDGSTDGTRDIIRFWRDRFPEKLVFVGEEDTENLGLPRTFSSLMRASSADYVLIADQDDVWYRDKISNAVQAMQSLEQRQNSSHPLLIHTDVRMVDRNLHQMRSSGYKHRGLRPGGRASVGTLCLENAAPGCTIIANKALLELSYPIPDKNIHPDWWLAFVAAAFGSIQAKTDISMDYRRHDLNISSLPSLAGTLRGVVNPLNHRRAFYEKLRVNERVAQEFLDRFDGRLSEQHRETLKAFLKLRDLSFWDRRYSVLKHRLWFSSWIRSVGFFLFV